MPTRDLASNAGAPHRTRNRSPQFKLDNPELSWREIAFKISETWNSFGPDEKAEYEEMAGEAKAAYAIAKAAFDEKMGKFPAPKAPKQALSPWMLYLSDNRARIKVHALAQHCRA